MITKVIVDILTSNSNSTKFRNITQEASPKSLRAKPIAVFLHIGCSSRAPYILEKILAALRFSGLLQVATLHVGFSGDGMYPLPKYVPVSRRPYDAFEHTTLDGLRAYADATPDAKILYIHTKAARFPVSYEAELKPLRWLGNDSEVLPEMVLHIARSGQLKLFLNYIDRNYSTVREGMQSLQHYFNTSLSLCNRTAGSPACIDDWKDLMLYFLIWLYRPCLEALETHETVGINPFGGPQHFSGNFWWATASYISTLPTLQRNRMDAEFWIGQKCNVTKMFCPFRSGFRHYTQRYLPENYMTQDIVNAVFNAAGDPAAPSAPNIPASCNDVRCVVDHGSSLP
jgi:hypothetical protein